MNNLSVKDHIPLRCIYSEQRRRTELEDYNSIPTENIDIHTLSTNSRKCISKVPLYTTKERPTATTPNAYDLGHVKQLSSEDEDNLLSIEIKLKRVLKYSFIENSLLRLAVPYRILAKFILHFIKTLNKAKNKVFLKIPIFPKTSFGKHENCNGIPVQFHSLCYKEVEQIFAEEKIRVLKRNNGRLKQTGNESKKPSNILSLQNSPTKEDDKSSFNESFTLTPTKYHNDRRISLFGRTNESHNKLLQRVNEARVSLNGSPVKRRSARIGNDVFQNSAARNMKKDLYITTHSRSISLHHR